MREPTKDKPQASCTDLIPLRRMNPFSAWRILQFLLKKLAQHRKP